MQIEHVAIWTPDLEQVKDFYVTYFDAQAGERYTSPSHPFASYFLTFASGARLELMWTPGLEAAPPGDPIPPVGYAHLAFATGSREAVDALTGRLRRDGYRVLSEPRTTGDGYYESVVLDPDGNRVEITA